MGEVLQQPFKKLRSKDGDRGEEDDDDVSKPTSFPYTLAGCVVQTRGTSPPDLQDRIQDPGPSASTTDDNPTPGSHPKRKGVQWLSKEQLCSTDFSKLSTDYLVNLEKVCERHRITLEKTYESHSERENSPRKTRDSRKRKRKKVKKDSVQTNEQLSQSRVDKPSYEEWKEGLEELSYEEWKERILSEEDSESVSKTKDSGKRKHKKLKKDSVETNKQLRQGERDELSYEEWRKRILSEEDSEPVSKTKDSGKRKRKRLKKDSAETNKQLRQGEVDNQSFEESGKSILSEEESEPASTSCSQGAIKDCQYVVYDKRSFQEIKRQLEREGQMSEGTRQVFHKSYQWLLEHCAALVGIEWTDIQEAVMTLEKALFHLETPG